MKAWFSVWTSGKWQKSMALFFRDHHDHSAEASFAWNPHAAEFKPGQELQSLGQAAKYEVGNLMARMEIYCHDS